VQVGEQQPGQRDALTELVKSVVGRGKRWSTREFATLAVDPGTGWSPSKSLLGKIINGEGYKVEPRLVSAFAVGLGLPREVVATAAHWQVIGYKQEELDAPAPATLLRHLMPACDGNSNGNVDRAPRAEAVAERWNDDENETIAE
jgi:hypothetical protein